MPIPADRLPLYSTIFENVAVGFALLSQGRVRISLGNHTFSTNFTLQLRPPFRPAHQFSRSDLALLQSDPSAKIRMLGGTVLDAPSPGMTHLIVGPDSIDRPEAIPETFGAKLVTKEWVLHCWVRNSVW
jgi:hypothetical protein